MSPVIITFQPVTADDFEELATLRIAAMRESLERAGRFDLDRARERLRASFHPECTRCIVVDGRRAGFYAFRPAEDGFHFDHLYVHPDCQSRGIGSSVLRQLFAQADEQGARIHLGTLRGSASNRFYQRHGFVPVAEDEWDIYCVREPMTSDAPLSGILQQFPMIAPLPLPVSAKDVRDLARLLVDAVESGAAVSFLAPLSLEEAEAWWSKAIATASPSAIFLVARDGGEIVGTVQAHPAWAPNQPHRAEIAKLIVHRRARGAGLGTALMHAVEEAAREAGFGLLTLDTKGGSRAEALYRRLGWTCVGVIPGFALDPDRRAWHDDVIFYKVLTPVS